MSNSHRVSLHLSRGNSITESPKDYSGGVNAGFSKVVENAERTREQLEKLNEFVSMGTETVWADGQEKDLVYYKQLAKKLQKEKKEIEQENKEMKLILKELKPKPGTEKILESSKKLIKDFGKDFNLEIQKELGDPSEFLALIKLNNVQEAFIRSLNLCRAVMKKKSNLVNSGSVSPRTRISDLIEDDLSQLMKETSLLGAKIVEKKVDEIARKIENS